MCQKTKRKEKKKRKATESTFIARVSTSYLGGCFDGSAVLEEQLYDFDAVLLAGDVQRREAVEGARVRVALLPKEKITLPMSYLANSCPIKFRRSFPAGADDGKLPFLRRLTKSTSSRNRQNFGHRNGSNRKIKLPHDGWSNPFEPILTHSNPG